MTKGTGQMGEQKKTLRMSGNLPGKSMNGFAEHHERFYEEQAPEPIVALVVIERHSLKRVDGSGDLAVATKFTAIEPLDGDDAADALKQMEQLREERTGETTLDMEPEA